MRCIHVLEFMLFIFFAKKGMKMTSKMWIFCTLWFVFKWLLTNSWDDWDKNVMKIAKQSLHKLKKKDLQHENIHIQKQCRSPRVHVDKLVLTIPSTSVWLCSEASGGNSEPTDHLATSLGSIFSQPSASGNTSSFIDCCYKQGRVGYLIYHQLIYHQSIYQLLHNTKFPEPKGT